MLETSTVELFGNFHCGIVRKLPLWILECVGNVHCPCTVDINMLEKNSVSPVVWSCDIHYKCRNFTSVLVTVYTGPTSLQTAAQSTGCPPLAAKPPTTVIDPCKEEWELEAIQHSYIALNVPQTLPPLSGQPTVDAEDFIALFHYGEGTVVEGCQRWAGSAPNNIHVTGPLESRGHFQPMRRYSGRLWVETRCHLLQAGEKWYWRWFRWPDELTRQGEWWAKEHFRRWHFSFLLGWGSQLRKHPWEVLWPGSAT